MSREDMLSREIISAAIEAHRHTGPGMLESVYEQCLCVELGKRGLGFERQVRIPVNYKGCVIGCGYRMDLLVDGLVVVELKAVGALEKIHEAQLLTYLKLSGKRLGILMNFNVVLLREGIKRVVNGL
jgi:GxxExxY protein